MKSVIVVGGGIVGTSITYHLSRRDDVSVRLLERAGSLGTATTRQSSLGFRQYGSEPVHLRMKRVGKRLYNEFMADPTSDLRYEQREVLYVATTDEGRSAIEDAQAEEDPASSPSEFVGGTEVHDVFVLPELREDVVTAALCRPNSGFFHSAEKLVDSFADRAETNGAEVVVNAEVTDLVIQNGRVCGVLTDETTHRADAVVGAAGPWNDVLTTAADVDVPVRQRRLDRLTLQPNTQFRRPLPKVRHVETGVTIRGCLDGSVLAYRVEPADDPYAAADAQIPDEEATVSADAKARIFESIETLLPPLADAEILSSAVSYPSRTPDAKPIIGWTERPGFAIAAMHSRGIQYAPAAGQIIARQLVDDDPTEYYPDVSITRFEGKTDCTDW